MPEETPGRAGQSAISWAESLPRIATAIAHEPDLERMVSIVAKPRPIVQLGDYYGPEPRKFYADPELELAEVAAPAESELRH